MAAKKRSGGVKRSKKREHGIEDVAAQIAEFPPIPLVGGTAHSIGALFGPHLRSLLNGREMTVHMLVGQRDAGSVLMRLELVEDPGVDQVAATKDLLGTAILELRRMVIRPPLVGRALESLEAAWRIATGEEDVPREAHRSDCSCGKGV